MLYIFWLLHQTTTQNRMKRFVEKLYIFWLLHQTTTGQGSMWKGEKLYIFWLLHQTTTPNEHRGNAEELYIFWLLHQTTTLKRLLRLLRCCISFDSYIKPQLIWVLLLVNICCISFDSYIKPQLPSAFTYLGECCISFDSYIKPQPNVSSMQIAPVVYLLTPTSNHNCAKHLYMLVTVVYLLTPTSNHNDEYLPSLQHVLYIFWLLHQTTTCCEIVKLYISCISFDSYIKPQLVIELDAWFAGCISFDSYIKPQPLNNSSVLQYVVYLLTPTSNHNCVPAHIVRYKLYIFWLLHQTTTNYITSLKTLCCISFDSYIKPQLRHSFAG